MKKALLNVSIIFTLAALLTACAPYQPKIDVDSDPAFAAGSYSTWNFISPLALEEAGYPESMVTQFQSSIEAAMRAQGYVRAENPDLLINVATTISGEGDTSLQSDAYQAIHPQRGTFHNSWRGYGEGYGSSSRQARYGEGSINVGVISAEARELVWEGVASGRLSGDRSDEERDALIDSTTRQMLTELPRAGSS